MRQRGMSDGGDVEEGEMISKPSLILLAIMALIKYLSIVFILIACAIPVYTVAGRWTLFLNGYDCPSKYTQYHHHDENLYPTRSILQYDYTVGCDTASLILFLPTMFVMYGTTLLCLTVAFKWLVVFRYSPGFHALGSWMYYRWSFMDTLFGVADIVFVSTLRGTIFQCIYYRLLGADVALDAILETTKISCYDLVSIRSGVVLMNDAVVRAETLVPDGLFMGRVIIDKHTVVGPRAMIMPLSEVPANLFVPPMTKSGPDTNYDAFPFSEHHASLHAILYWLLLLCRGFIHAILLGVLAFFSGFAVTVGVVVVSSINHHQNWNLGYLHLLMAPVGYFVAGIAMWILGAGARWLFLFPFTTGQAVSFTGFFMLRKWFVDRLLALSYKYFILIFSGSIIPSLFLISLGTRIRGLVQFEFMEMQFSEAALLSIGHQSFWSAYSGIEGFSHVDVGNRTITFEDIVVGKNTFIGNHSVLCGGATIHPGGLVADLTLLPPGSNVDGTKIAMGTEHDLILADRPASLNTERHWTVRLLLFQIAQFIFECYFIWLMIYLGIGAYRLFQVADQSLGPWTSWQALPPDTLLGTNPMRSLVLFTLPIWIIWIAFFLFITLAHKRVLYMGVESSSFEDEIFSFRHAQYWSFRIFMVALNRIFLNGFAGSPIVTFFYSQLGVRIHYRSYIFSQQMLILEPDLLTLQNGIIIAPDCIIQCHNFAKGTLAVSPVTISSESIIGEESVFGNNIVVQHNVNIQPRSSILSGESCDAGTLWGGSPASRLS